LPFPNLGFNPKHYYSRVNFPETMPIDVVSYLPAIGGWGIVGFGVGFVAKKLFKYLLIVVGIYFGSLLYLQHRGWVSINEGFQGFVEDLGPQLVEQAEAVWSSAAFSLPVFGAFGAGAYLGFRKG